MFDIWAEEELKVGTLSNGTVENYLGAIRCIKKHPIADRRLKTVTAEHLQILRLSFQLDVLHWIERNQLLWEYRKTERLL
mgnify:CR=1 FL=1